MYFSGTLYKIHLNENTACDSGLLWEGDVGEPDSLNQRIQECQQKCDANANCKFMFVNTVNDWCKIHSSCDTFRTPNKVSLTFAKRGNLTIQKLRLNEKYRIDGIQYSVLLINLSDFLP